jgi:hypothetical protein
LGSEPDWDDIDELTEGEMRSRFGNALNWYNYNYNTRNLQDFLVKWMKQTDGLVHHAPAVAALESHHVGPTYGSVACMLMNNFEFPEHLAREESSFHDKLVELIDAGKKILEEKKAKIVAKAQTNVPVLSIQARTRNAARNVIGHIEGEIDEFIESGCKEKINIYDYLQKAGIKGGYMSYVTEHFQPLYEEVQEVLKSDDEQLKEGYAFLSKPRKKKLVAFYANIISDCREWQKDCRGKRKARKRKVKTPKELVKFLNFKSKDEDFGIESVKPADIIGASQVWVFDTKTRFMHKYVSDIGMTVKGSTLKEFDPNQSFKKKIREAYCKQVLDDVVTGGKVKLKKSLANIAAKEVAVTGRIGNEMVIVRVMK